MRLHHQRGNLWICTGKSVPIFRYCDCGANCFIGGKTNHQIIMSWRLFRIRDDLIWIRKAFTDENFKAMQRMARWNCYPIKFSSCHFTVAGSSPPNHISRFQLSRLHHNLLSFFAQILIQLMRRTVHSMWDIDFQQIPNRTLINFEKFETYWDLNCHQNPIKPIASIGVFFCFNAHAFFVSCFCGFFSDDVNE